MTDDALLLPVSACPGVLDGWCGPVVTSRTVEHRGRVGVLLSTDGDSATVGLYPRAPSWTFLASSLDLDLSRAECRDRVARWMADAIWVEPEPRSSTGPRWECAAERRWYLGRFNSSTYFLPYALYRQPPGVPTREVGVPTLADLDGTDGTCLPDGSRWVDARALLLCAMAVRS